MIFVFSNDMVSGVDVIVHDPDDAARPYAEVDPLIREAFERGRVHHERRGWSIKMHDTITGTNRVAGKRTPL